MSVLRQLPFLIVLAVLLTGAWWQGLFFEEAQVAALLVLLLAAAGHLLLQLPRPALAPVEGAVFLLPLVVGVSAWGAASPHLARLEGLQYLALTGSFLLVRQSRPSLWVRHMLQAGLLLAGCWVTLYGLLTKGGLLTDSAALTKGRIGSVLQYPNALGAFAGALLLGAINLLPFREHPLHLLARLVLPVLLYGVVFSFSRGVWLLLLPVFGVLVWLQPPRRKMPLLLQVAGSLLPALALLPLVHRSFSTPLWWLLLLGLAVGLSFGGGQLADRLIARWNPGRFAAPFRQQMRLALAVCAVLAAGGGLLLLFLRQRQPGTLHDSSFVARYAYIKDALRLFLDFPLLGAGGGAWVTMYESYQRQPYRSSQVHNFPLQILTDTGLAGVVVFAGVFLLLLRQAVQAARQPTADGVESRFFLVVVLLLLLHSCLDFDLSFFYLALVLWVALAATVPADAESTSAQPRQLRLPPQATLVMCVLLMLALCRAIFISSRQVLAVRSNERGNELAQTGRFADALPLFREATALAPYHLGYRQATASVQEALARYASNARQLQDSRQQFAELVQLEPRNPKVYRAIAGLHERDGNYGQAMQARERVLALSPYNWHAYEELLQTAAIGARAGRLSAGDARQALAQYTALAQRRQSLRQQGKRLLRKFSYTETMHLAGAQLALQIGDAAAAAAISGQVLSSQNPRARELAAAYYTVCLEQLRPEQASSLAALPPGQRPSEKYLQAVRQLPRLR